MRRALPLLLALVIAGGCGGDDESPLADALQRGGVVLVMRHAKTENTTDRVEVIGDCSTQRNLNAEGREQARQVGIGMEEVGVPVDEVLTSPLCRAKDTADLAFGSSTIRRFLLSAGEEATPADERRIRKLKAFSSPPAGSATVLVTHSGNIGGAYDLSVLEGEVVVVRDGKVLGTVKPEEWEDLTGGSD